MNPIAVFDSGLGGISVLRELVQQMPQEHFLYFGDSANAPYGPRSTGEIRALTLQHAARLFDQGAKALVVACNTATSAAIDVLRAQYPDQIVIGIEPALKPAVDAHPRGKILVLATDATLREEKFHALMSQYAAQCNIRKCPCPELVSFVEQGELSGQALRQYLQRTLQGHLLPPPDAVVLGCTHFPFLKEAIVQVVGPQAAFFDGAQGTALHTRRRLLEAGLLKTEGPGSVTMTNSSPSNKLLQRAHALLQL